MEAICVGVAGTFVPIGFMAVIIAKEFKSEFTQNSLVLGGAIMAFLGIVLRYSSSYRSDVASLAKRKERARRSDR